MLKNEPFSFQALYRAKTGSGFTPFCLKAEAIPCTIGVPLPIRAWRVDYVPLLTTRTRPGDICSEDTNPGLYPDILMPRPAVPELEARVHGYSRSVYYFEKDVCNLLNAIDSDYQSVWFTLNPDSLTLMPGDYTVTVTAIDLNTGTAVAEQTLSLEILDAELPEQDVYYTNWFHVDCICDMFGVEAYSDAFYEIFDSYITNMTAHRQNVLLLPAFTPALDTPVDGERRNVQLVSVTRKGAEWHFSFDKMRRFIRHAEKCGIRYFEHCHLYSQWGAEHAPNIYDADGKRIFGSETDAFGEEYRAFLRSYLKAFLAFAKEEGISERLIFHISDEPTLSQLENYRRAKNAIADLLEGYVVADAMSHTEFYTEGLLNHPVAHITGADLFSESCPSFWLYYTGGEQNHANRRISDTAACTRSLGLQLYRCQARGFLHWAYNFYYDRLSAGQFSPAVLPGGYKALPGITCLAYPITGNKATPVVPSIREKLLAEGFDDLRALKLLESRIGRDAVMDFLHEQFGEIRITTVPTGDAMLHFRMALNRKIKETN